MAQNLLTDRAPFSNSYAQEITAGNYEILMTLMRHRRANQFFFLIFLIDFSQQFQFTRQYPNSNHKNRVIMLIIQVLKPYWMNLTFADPFKGQFWWNWSDIVKLISFFLIFLIDFSQQFQFTRQYPNSNHKNRVIIVIIQVLKPYWMNSTFAEPF